MMDGWMDGWMKNDTIVVPCFNLWFGLIWYKWWFAEPRPTTEGNGSLSRIGARLNVYNSFWRVDRN